MIDCFDFEVDVLASDPAEINEIEVALQEPGEELIVKYAKEHNKKPVEITFEIKEVAALKPTCNLENVHQSWSEARRFENRSCSSPYLALDHVYSVSKNFPKAIFLVQRSFEKGLYKDKYVIRAGDKIRCSHVGFPCSESCEWAMPDIFAPYEAEHAKGEEFGSIWDIWIDAWRSGPRESREEQLEYQRIQESFAFQEGELVDPPDDFSADPRPTRHH